MAARSYLNVLTLPLGRFRGFKIAVFTYMVGFFALQLTYPKWTKHPRRRPSLPSITQAAIWDSGAVPIWPNIDAATWPPAKYISDDLLDTFLERFRHMHLER